MAMNPRERVQTIHAQAAEVRDAIANLVKAEGETATSTAIVQIALLSILLADVTASLLAEAAGGESS